MSALPPYEMSQPPEGPPPRQSTSVWVWVLVGLAGMCVLCGVIGAAVLFPVFAQARLAAKKSVSLSYARQVSISVLLYSTDFDDTLPPIDNGPAVANRLKDYLNDKRGSSNNGRIRESLKSKAASYMWNTTVSGIALPTIGNVSDVWMFYSTEPPEMKSLSMAFLDSHSTSVLRDDVPARTAVKPIIEKPKK